MLTPAEAMLADQLITQGLTYWQNAQAAKAAGTFTPTDLVDAAKKLDADITKLSADILARQPRA